MTKDEQMAANIIDVLTDALERILVSHNANAKDIALQALGKAANIAFKDEEN